MVKEPDGYYMVVNPVGGIGGTSVRFEWMPTPTFPASECVFIGISGLRRVSDMKYQRIIGDRDILTLEFLDSSTLRQRFQWDYITREFILKRVSYDFDRDFAGDSADVGCNAGTGIFGLLALLMFVLRRKK